MIAGRFSRPTSSKTSNTKDLHFQVIDAPWLVESHLESQGHEVAAVECPARIVPDGGELVCDAAVDPERRLRVTIARRGGEHRVVEVEQAG